MISRNAITDAAKHVVATCDALPSTDPSKMGFPDRTATKRSVETQWPQSLLKLRDRPGYHVIPSNNSRRPLFKHQRGEYFVRVASHSGGNKNDGTTWHRIDSLDKEYEGILLGV